MATESARAALQLTQSIVEDIKSLPANSQTVRVQSHSTSHTNPPIGFVNPAMGFGKPTTLQPTERQEAQRRLSQQQAEIQALKEEVKEKNIIIAKQASALNNIHQELVGLHTALYD